MPSRSQCAVPCRTSISADRPFPDRQAAASRSPLTGPAPYREDRRRQRWTLPIAARGSMLDGGGADVRPGVAGGDRLTAEGGRGAGREPASDHGCEARRRRWAGWIDSYASARQAAVAFGGRARRLARTGPGRLTGGTVRQPSGPRRSGADGALFVQLCRPRDHRAQRHVPCRRSGPPRHPPHRTGGAADRTRDRRSTRPPNSTERRVNLIRCCTLHSAAFAVDQRPS